MKRYLIILLPILFFAAEVIGQNVIHLSEKSKHLRYIDYSEQMQGFWCAVEVEQIFYY